MALCWPTRPSSFTDNVEPISFPIAVSELPGVTQAYDWRDRVWVPFEDVEHIRRVTLIGSTGKVGAISRSAKNAKLAGIFLGWATSPEQSVQLCPRANFSAPFRKSHRSAVKNWCDERMNSEATTLYLDSLHSALRRSESFISPRLPGQNQYMQVLDKHLLTALRGESSVANCLQNVHDEWNAITERLGRDNQVKAYCHSLGIDVD